MIKFVIMENKEEKIKSYRNIIDKLLIESNIHYETCVIKEEGAELTTFCKNFCGSCVFIIDNDNENIDGLSIANKIRSIYKIYVAFMIIIDTKKELNVNTIMNNYGFLCELIQLENVEKKLNSDLKYILNVIYDRQKVLTFNYEKVLYLIPFKDILYVEKELNGKKCMIVCRNRTYMTYKSLKKLEEELDERFLKSHQSAVINSTNVREVDFINNRIIFDNKNECTLLSRNMKKELKVVLPNKQKIPQN